MLQQPVIKVGETRMQPINIKCQANKSLGIWIEIEKNGEVIYSEPGHSYIGNFMKTLRVAMAYTRKSESCSTTLKTAIIRGTVNGTYENREIATIDLYYNPFYNLLLHPSTSDTAVSLDDTDFVLAANGLIEDGSTAGKLTYGTLAISTPQTESDTDYAYIEFTQNFTNATANPIVIKSLLTSYNDYRIYIPTSRTLLTRDLLASPYITVDPSELITIKYRYRTFIDTVGGYKTGFVKTFLNGIYNGSAASNSFPFTCAYGSDNSFTDVKEIQARYGIQLSENDYTGFTASETLGAGSKLTGNILSSVEAVTTEKWLRGYGNVIGDYDDTDHEFTISKVFENISGATVTAKSVGLNGYISGLTNNIGLITLSQVPDIVFNDGDFKKINITLGVTL